MASSHAGLAFAYQSLPVTAAQDSFSAPLSEVLLGGGYFLTSLWCYHSQADFPNSNSP